ncbi:Pyridine nucleotide-disulfide oxidoreductase domain-containing protein 1-like [Homarus americanus]|uniref:Pyridine nucleotide-disulfide oxidoreductase domain-containing protein 1 n=1 Tax=Homarus americanus TaxID=6706 RepID=A0A8J5N866_HOMAM|nr:Pyridine nucleotide-disulfide oxidoreductase domain-containing protein 1-like [Homarus americanus]
MDLGHEQSSMEEYSYVVVGGGIAGVTCAEHLYILHPEAEILVITATPLIKAVTNVLPLTKTLDSFDVEERPAEELKNNCPNVTVAKDTVAHLDADKQLCVCTGASPKLIDNSPHVVWIRDTESACQFQSRIQKAKRILIVGNGGIATEMVFEVTGLQILWVIKDKFMTANFIDAGAAEFLRPELDKEKSENTFPLKRRKYTVDKMEAGASVLGGALGPDWHTGLELKGDIHRKVTIETEVEIRKILEPVDVRQPGKTITTLNSEEGEWPVYVELTNGKVYGCDFIVSAIGVTPNTSNFLKGNKFTLGEEGGFLVNEKMETSEKNVYAAGDVCTPGWQPAQHWFQMRLWTQARQMGSYAAKCMWSSLAKEEIYMDFCFELFSHATKFFGYKVILLGLFNGQRLEGKYEILLRYTKGMEYIKCVMVDGRMQGAVLIGETNMEETFENLILNQMDLSVYGEDLLNPDVDIEDYFD